MSLLENQTFRKKINFVKSDDVDKLVSFVISVSCNHDIDKNILNEIEDTINDMFLKDYVNKEEKELEQKLKKEQEKLNKEQEKHQLKEKQRAEMQFKKREIENERLKMKNFKIMSNGTLVPITKLPLFTTKAKLQPF